MKIRYDKMMLEELEWIRASGRTPRLLLHVCCAPCTSGCLDRLTDTFEVTCYYYNPNISPKEELSRRYAELVRLTGLMAPDGRVTVEEGPYDPERFEALARGLESLPEGGERCARCYRLRLTETARKAREEGYDYFATTLSVSPYKNAEKLNLIGAELSAGYGVKWLYADFKKNDGYLRSIRRSAEYGLYRQDYCGCSYSREARLIQKQQSRADAE